MKHKILSLATVALAGGISANAASTRAMQEPSDSISLPGYEQLDELVIEAERPVMQTDGAKLTYNVEEDPAAGSSSVLDMLKKVPQISVDGEGNVHLNGSDAFKIQLNGLDNPMLKQYGNQIFQAMPASSVVKIEVITEPGAKEDAEGTAGIINIITERKQSSDGYSGSISLQASNRSLTPSLYGVMKKGNVTLSANLNYQWGFLPQKSGQDLTTTYLDSNDPGKLVSSLGQKMKHHYTGGNINMSWEPNPNNLFTAGADLFYVNGNLYSIFGTTERFDPLGNLMWSFRQDGTGKVNILNVSANAAYRHNFGYDGNHLILSYLFNYGRNHIGIERWYPETENYNPGFTYQNQDTKTFDRGHTVQADYANDFHSEHHLMEVGVKGIFRHNTALADYYYGMQPDQLISLPGLNSNILQPQNIYAAYASYTGKFGNFGVVGGLRYEHTLMGITDRTDRKNDFRNHLNDWVPNAALTWNFSNSSNLRLSYQMRISRPSIEQVNPFELSFTPYQINKGNPDLTSERNHIVSIKYSAFGRSVGGSVGLEYNRADNAISSFTYLWDNDGVDAVVTSYANIGKKQNVALTGFFNWTVISNMTLAVNGRLAYNTIKAPTHGYSNHGWSGNIGAFWNYTVAKVNKFSLYGAWFSRRLEVQGYNSGFYYYGLSASRDFLADKSLTLSLSANNFLQSTMKFKGHTATPQVIYDNVAFTHTAWNVAVSLSWKFGSLKAKVKDTGVEVKNDDINSSSNKGQAGGLGGQGGL